MSLPYPFVSTIMQRQFHNRSNYNYWKVLLVKYAPNLSSLVYQAEAFVRFMSGSFWAIIVGLIPGLIYVLINLSRIDGRVLTSIYYVLILLMLMVVIAVRFKNQRRREVKVLLDSILSLSETDKKFRALLEQKK